MRRHANQHLVQHRRHKKHGQARRRGLPPAANQGHVDVALKVGVHGPVPSAPVRPQALAVPPVVVEEAVAEARHLGQRIEKRLKNGEKPGKPDDEGNRRQLQQALQNGKKIQRGNLVERVEQHGRGVLGAREPDKDGQAHHLAEALPHVHPANLVSARIHWLIHKRGRPPKVRHVVNGNVVRVGAGLVELRDGLALDGVEVGVAQVAVGKGVRGGLEPDDEGVGLGHGANERVVNVKVDDDGGDDEGEGDVEHVRPGDDDPDVVKLAPILVRGADGALVHSLAGADGLGGGGELNEIGGKEVAGDEAKEAESEQDVVASKVVTFEADENAILFMLE